jgi:hypothetical protein
VTINLLQICSYFWGPDSANEFVYYFQMDNGGLPSAAGAMAYCQLAPGHDTGNAMVQGEITGDKCLDIGAVSDQVWEIDTSQNPQVITITFSGGVDGRTSVVAVTCDPSANYPAFVVKGETRAMVYEVQMTSRFACGPPPSPPNPPPSPPPSPPNPPSPSFRCMSNTCIRLPANSTASGYDTLALCEKGCGPPFWCVDP